MKLESAEFKCMACGKKFLAPRLGDMSYGLFIFSGEKGSVFGCFKALENPAWNFMETIIKKQGIGRQASIDHGDRLRSACAHFSDAINGQRLHSDPVCPRCYSTNTEAGISLSKVIEVPDVSHNEFLSLPESVRRQKVLEFYESSFLEDSAKAMFKDMDQQESS
jgi:hypothetical protein